MCLVLSTEFLCHKDGETEVASTKKAVVPPIKQEPKPFCPRLMVQYDGAIGEYETR